MPQGLSEAYASLETATRRAQELHDRAGGRRALCFPETQKFWAVVLQYGVLMVCHADDLPTPEQGTSYAPGDFLVLYRSQNTEQTWKPSPAFLAHEAFQRFDPRAKSAFRAFHKIDKRMRPVYDAYFALPIINDSPLAEQLNRLRRKWNKAHAHCERMQAEGARLWYAYQALNVVEGE